MTSKVHYDLQEELIIFSLIFMYHVMCHIQCISVSCDFLSSVGAASINGLEFSHWFPRCLPELIINLETDGK